jgi:hypothetical protein
MVGVRAGKAPQCRGGCPVPCRAGEIPGAAGDTWDRRLPEAGWGDSRPSARALPSQPDLRARRAPTRSASLAAEPNPDRQMGPRPPPTGDGGSAGSAALPAAAAAASVGSGRPARQKGILARDQILAWQLQFRDRGGPAPPRQPRPLPRPLRAARFCRGSYGVSAQRCRRVRRVLSAGQRRWKRPGVPRCSRTGFGAGLLQHVYTRPGGAGSGATA